MFMQKVQVVSISSTQTPHITLAMCCECFYAKMSFCSTFATSVGEYIKCLEECGTRVKAKSVVDGTKWHVLLLIKVRFSA